MESGQRVVRFGRGGFTTGTCAAAAAKAATMLLVDALGVDALGIRRSPLEVEVALIDGTHVRIPILASRCNGEMAEAEVRKDAGGDADGTHGVRVIATVRWADGDGERNRDGESNRGETNRDGESNRGETNRDGDGDGIVWKAGEGVGVVTKPGLSVLAGEPAINPGPRAMIRAAVREITLRRVEVTIGIPGGRELAARTFNPRLGVVGGLSILGTTGRVRPFDVDALREALRCAVRVAKAASIASPVLVPGNIGWRAARRHFRCAEEQVLEVGNEWGTMLDELADRSFVRYLLVGHAGKLAKLAQGHWDTHSSRAPSALPWVAELAARLLGRALPEVPTVEGLFAALEPTEVATVASAIAARIAATVERRMHRPVAVVLVDMAGTRLAHFGDLAPWL